MDSEDVRNTAYKVEYEKIGDEVKAYLAEIPTTCAFGKTENEATVNLLLLLHGKREIPDAENDVEG